MKLHESITVDRVEEAVSRQMMDVEDVGFCISCGVEVENVEPYAKHRWCTVCCRTSVYGATLILDKYFT